MLRKSGKLNNSQTIKSFQQFMKKRQQKKNIVQSQNQSIIKKINCFEQLIKMNKNGQSITINIQKSSHHLKNSRKIIDQKKNNNNEIQQNVQSQAKKLNRMVHDINGWIYSKQNSEHHPNDDIKATQIKKTISDYKIDKKRNFEKNGFNFKKDKDNNKNIEDNQDKWFNQECKKAQRQNLIKQKKIYIRKPTRNNSAQCIRQNINIGKIIDQSYKKTQFTSLKRQISILQKRARQNYGLSFQKIDIKQSINEINQQCQLQSKNQNIIKLINNNQIKRQQSNPYQILVYQHTKQDSSVPINLLNYVRSSSAKSRKCGISTASMSRFIRV